MTIAESAPGAGDGSSVLLTSSLDDNQHEGVDQISFADGTIWSQADLRVKLLAQAATSGNETITGFNTADTISGGDGNDTINDGINAGNDTPALVGVNPADVSLTHNGNDLMLTVAESAPASLSSFVA